MRRIFNASSRITCMPPLKLWPDLRRKGAAVTTGIVMLVVPGLPLLGLLLLSNPLIVIAGVLLFVAALIWYWNSALFTAYRNNHTEFTEIRVDVTAANRVYRIQEKYDAPLDNVAHDVELFLKKADGITPVQSSVWQQRATGARPFSENGERDATIVIDVGYEPSTLYPSKLFDNLEAALETDDRFEELRDVCLAVQREDLRDVQRPYSNEYEELGAAVEPEYQYDED